ncbi:hypothetical protein EDD22DRAFT_896848, partial [Suillus occidentalis]
NFATMFTKRCIRSHNRRRIPCCILFICHPGLTGVYTPVIEEPTTMSNLPTAIVIYPIPFTSLSLTRTHTRTSLHIPEPWVTLLLLHIILKVLAYPAFRSFHASRPYFDTLALVCIHS